MNQQSKFAKKSLGQNFLTNLEVRDKILAEAGNLKDLNILEIGPGLGFLTEALLEAGCFLTAVEFDERAVKILEKKFGQHPRFTLISGNFLEIDLDELFEQKNYSIVANIPYNITNPILRKILEKTKNKPNFSILMVQKEVAQKICDPVSHKLNTDSNASKSSDDQPFGVPLQGVPQSLNTPKKSKRSILSIAVEVYAQARYCFTVPSEDFDPAPKVDSAIMKLETLDTPLIKAQDQRDFFTVVNAGFSEKRKKLGNVLGKFFGLEPAQLLGNINPNRRAETLSIEEWIEITENFKNHM